MNDTRHTPGPWGIGAETDDESAQIISQDGGHVATVGVYPLGPNANLIAAAPDLKSAIEGFMDAVAEGQSTSDLIWAVDAYQAEFRRVLAKAEGGAV
jgi:hypothetical protein